MSSLERLAQIRQELRRLAKTSNLAVDEAAMATGNTDQLSATSNEIAALVGLVLVELAAAYVDRDTGDSLVRVRTENPEG